jgi:hypothetical protein
MPSWVGSGASPRYPTSVTIQRSPSCASTTALRGFWRSHGGDQPFVTTRVIGPPPVDAARVTQIDAHAILGRGQKAHTLQPATQTRASSGRVQYELGLQRVRELGRVRGRADRRFVRYFIAPDHDTRSRHRRPPYPRARKCKSALPRTSAPL